MCVRKLLLTLLALQYSAFVGAQDFISNNERLLTDYCRRNQNVPGCSFPVPVPTTSTGSACGSKFKICTELPDVCVPRDIPCSAIGSGRTCAVPKGINVDHRVILCGSNNRGPCENNSRLPMITVIVVQCLSISELARLQYANFEIQELGEERPGKVKGAGMYYCGVDERWRPIATSPPIENLVSSCQNAGCGYVPKPWNNAPVNRPWSWIRSLRYRERECTATLVESGVASGTAITAAHCVTTTPSSIEIPADYDQFKIELPTVTVSVTEIYIHPRYQPNNRYVHDIAVIRFKLPDNTVLPTVCISDEYQDASNNRLQVIANRIDGTRNNWRVRPSIWSTDCRQLSVRNSFCGDQLTLKEGQFCAQHNGVPITSGSSGGPYLVEIGSGIEEVWSIQGVLSAVGGNRGCSANHLIFSSIVDDSQWLKKCVYEKRCDTFFSTVVGF